MFMFSKISESAFDKMVSELNQKLEFLLYKKKQSYV